MDSNTLTATLLIRLPEEFPCRVWRRNCGVFYGAAAVQKAKTLMSAGRFNLALSELQRARPVVSGPAGEPDIDGVVRIGAAGVRLGIEVKVGRDKQRDSQTVCQHVYEAHGAIYLIARDVEQCIADLRAEIERRKA